MKCLLGFSFVLVLAAAACLIPSAAAQPPQAVLEAEADRVAVVAKIAPAVVAVCIYGGQAIGSGVVIDPEGFALTNHHVTQPAGSIMQCGLADGQLYDAVIVGQDKIGDVALVKLIAKQPGKPFPFVTLGDSDKVKIGDWSLALGNPFSIALDFTPTVTYGLVSGTNRYEPMGSQPGISEYTDCIQVDTSINPGNSGGPLFNMKGELIGINGRINFEKRVRINSGVGYAISINQIKNFLGHFYAGIDTDHASLGAVVGTADESSDLQKMVVKQLLDESDAARRGLLEGDRVLNFAGRKMTSANMYKNILGTLPKDWRVPMTVQTGTARRELLVRVQNITPGEKAPPPGMPPGPMPTPGPMPKGPSTGDSPAAKLLKLKPGYVNYYFNEVQRDKLLAAAKKQGDFAPTAGAWTAEGTYDLGERKGAIKLEVNEKTADPFVKLGLNIEFALHPFESGLTPRAAAEPVGSGGLMMALYHYHRFLTVGAKGFEGEFAHAGSEPFYPYPADGTAPKSLASLRVDADVIRTKHGSVTCKWYFAKSDAKLLGFEMYLAKDTDPCEIYLHEYKDAGGGLMLPHRMEVRFGDKRYGYLNIAKYNVK